MCEMGGKLRMWKLEEKLRVWDLGGKLRIWELREKWSRKISEGSPDELV